MGEDIDEVGAELRRAVVRLYSRFRSERVEGEVADAALLVLIVLAIFAARNLQNSRLGRAWMAIREDELAARHMGMAVLGLSLVTNPASGVSAEPIDHREVIEIGRRAAERFTALLKAILGNLP